MFEISFEINGREVSPQQIGTEIGRATLQSIKDFMVKSVGSIRCPEHGEAAKIVCRGGRLDALAFEILGCCNTLVESVTTTWSNDGISS